MQREIALHLILTVPEFPDPSGLEAFVKQHVQTDEELHDWTVYDNETGEELGVKD